MALYLLVKNYKNIPKDTLFRGSWKIGDGEKFGEYKKRPYDEYNSHPFFQYRLGENYEISAKEFNKNISLFKEIKSKKEIQEWKERNENKFARFFLERYYESSFRLGMHVQEDNDGIETNKFLKRNNKRMIRKIRESIKIYEKEILKYFKY